VDRLERTVVQLVEARRLADFDDVPHGRLALLLFDNAAETLLSRRAKEALIEAGWYGNALKKLAHIEVEDEKLAAFREELESKAVSEKTRQSIEKNFSDLVKFVFSRADCNLEPELAACLNALHRFRNDAYHGDFVRSDVLGPANEIYFYLCCRLLKAQTYLMMQMGDPPAVVIDQLPSLKVSPSGWSDEKMLGDAVADELLARNHLDHGGISSSLSAHLIARVASVEGDLNQFMEYMDYEEDRPLGLRVIQLLPLSVDGPVWPDDFLTRPLVVTDRTIHSWARGAASIANLSLAQDALRQFDEIESAIARFEDQLEPFIHAIDREIEREIDRLRGK
jgi:hypothetical protein